MLVTWTIGFDNGKQIGILFDPKLSRATLREHDSIHRHRNQTQSSAIARHRSFESSKICKITVGGKKSWSVRVLRQDPPPLEAILVIFGRRALIFFCLKALGKKWKMTPLLCACAVVITLETQKCRKRAPRSVEFNFFNNCDRHKRFSQNERRRADLQKLPQIF